MPIPDVIKELLPSAILTALTSAVTFAVLFETFRTLRQGGAAGILEKRRVRQLRAFFIALLVILAAQATTSPSVTNPLTWLPFLVVLILYGVAELVLFFWLRSFLNRPTLLSTEHLRTCVANLEKRQAPDGGFRVRGGTDDRTELWTSAQVVHGLVAAVDRVEMAGITDRVIGYFRGALQDKTIWTDDPRPLVSASGWSLIALVEITKAKHWEDIAPAVKEEVRGWIRRGFTELVGAQTEVGGWTSLGNQREADIRSLPTLVAMWALGRAIGAGTATGLSETEVRAGVDAIDRGWHFVRDTAIPQPDAAGEVAWDSNPKRGWRRRSSALTLLTYAVLLAVAADLNQGSDRRGVDTATEITKWARANHDPVMRHVDYCMHRDFNDNEADEPWDHVVQDRQGQPAEVSITYFDWPTSALFALAMCKQAKVYDYSDASREQALASLMKQSEKIENAYSFRLAMILIGSSVAGQLRSI